MSTETLPPPPTIRLHGQRATTPERLRVAMVVVVAALLGAALVAIGATDSRRSAPQAARAIAAIAASLPEYTGLVETARANHRQGFPVGAAYLRDASELMRGRILASAGDLYRLETLRLNDHQAAATRSRGPVKALF